MSLRLNSRPTMAWLATTLRDDTPWKPGTSIGRDPALAGADGDHLQIGISERAVVVKCCLAVGESVVPAGGRFVPAGGLVVAARAIRESGSRWSARRP